MTDPWSTGMTRIGTVGEDYRPTVHSWTPDPEHPFRVIHIAPDGAVEVGSRLDADAQVQLVKLGVL